MDIAFTLFWASFAAMLVAIDIVKHTAIAKHYLSIGLFVFGCSGMIVCTLWMINIARSLG